MPLVLPYTLEFCISMSAGPPSPKPHMLRLARSTADHLSQAGCNCNLLLPFRDPPISCINVTRDLRFYVDFKLLP